MKLYIKYKDDREYGQIDSDLKKEFSNKVKIRNTRFVKSGEKLTNNELSKRQMIMEVKFSNNPLFDDSEDKIFNYIRKNYRIVLIQKISKRFNDIHKVGNTKTFKEAVIELNKTMSPIYIIKNGYWWIGMENIDKIKEFDVKEAIKQFYELGMGLSLIPSDFIQNKHIADEEANG